MNLNFLNKLKRGEKEIKHIGYVLYPQTEEIDKILLKGSSDNGEYFDDEIDLNDDNEWKWKNDGGREGRKGRKIIRRVMPAGTFVNVEDNHLVSVYPPNSEEPVKYVPPDKFSAKDLQLIETEKITKKGMKKAGGEAVDEGLGGSRLKAIGITFIIFVVIALVLFVLPKYVPFL